MAERGYVRFGKRVFLNIFEDAEKDRLCSILEDRNIDFKMEQEQYDKDWVTDTIIYSYTFGFDCDETTLISILSELNDADDNLSSDDTNQS